MTKIKTLSRGMLAAALAFPLAACGIFGGGEEKQTPTVGNRVPILSRIEAGATVDPALANVAVVLPVAQTNADWPQPGGTAGNAIGHVALAAAPAQVWSTQIAGSSTRRRLASSPVVGGGLLYVVDTDGIIRAFDAGTGAARWRVDLDLPADLAPSAFGGGVSYAGGQVFATDGAGNVIALDAQSGNEIWRRKPAGPLRGAPTIAFNQVFVMTQDNQIHALNAADGSPVWNETSTAAQAGVFGVAAPAAGQGTVIAGFSSGELTAYRYENGRNLWSDALARTSISTQVGTLTDVDADPIIDQGRVYALGQGGRMAAYELLTGQRLWELNIAGISTPAVAGEWLFVLADDAKLIAIQRATGRVRWITQLRAFRDQEDRDDPIFWTGPIAAGNQLWVASSRGAVERVDVATGAASSFVDVDSPVSLPPIVAGGMLYILDDSGRLRAYR